jgi:ribulose-bisphosphate carboxylase large chain
MEQVVATYYVESRLPTREAAKKICEECSTGTWTDVTTTTKRVEEKYSAKVIDVNENIAKIGIPIEDFEPGNVAQLLSVIAGNVFGLKEIKNLRLLDIDLPGELVKNFKGPQFGIDEIRDIVGVKNRPLIGTIVKPKIGLEPAEYSKVVYEAAMGGVDLVKMDETLTDQNFCRLEENVSWVMDVLDKAKHATGRKVLFAVNVTTRQDELVERAEKVLELGANCLMIDIICAGMSSIQILRDANLGVPIYCHRAGHAAFTRSSKHGIRWRVYCKLARLFGADVVHCGTIVGKMHGEENEVLEDYHALRDDWFFFNPTMPAASGGLHPALIGDLIKHLGNDMIMNFGGGIHGHPNGTRAGVIAVTQALDAAKQRISLKEYAKSHDELRIALEKWK